MKVYRTTEYHGNTIWARRYCTSKRQWAAVKHRLAWSSRMTLEMAEIPDDMWQLVEDLTDEY